MLKFDAQNELISNLMPATGLKIDGTGGMFTMLKHHLFFSKQF